MGNSSANVEFVDQGAVSLFERNFGGPDNWGAVLRLTDPDGKKSDYFGLRISISGDVLAVGVHGSDALGPDFGAVYLYKQVPNYPVFLPLLLRP